VNEDWARRTKAWAADSDGVFVYFINGFKPNAPAAAQAFSQLVAENRPNLPNK
jgi:uncharacterized protein YecE (DUF72 family)